MVVAGIVLVVLGVALWWFGARSSRRYAALVGTETSTAADLAATLDAVAAGIGDASLGRPCEVKGRAVALAGRTAPLSGEACAWYRTAVSEVVKEWQWHGTGDQRRRELVEREQPLSDERAPVLVLDDGTGTVAVDLAGTDVDAAVSVVNRRVRDNDGWTSTLEIRIGGISIGTDGAGVVGWHHREWIVPVGAEVFVSGEARKIGTEVRVSKPADSKRPFVVSLRSEEALTKSAGRTARLLRTGAGVCVLGGIVLAIVGIVR